MPTFHPARNRAVTYEMLHRETHAKRMLAWFDNQRRDGHADGASVIVSIRELTEITGLKKNKVIVYLRKLEHRDLIEVERRVDELGSDISNRYTPMPIDEKKRQRLGDAAKALGVTRSWLWSAMHRISQANLNIAATLTEFAQAARWEGDPMTFYQTLREHGFVEAGRVKL